MRDFVNKYQLKIGFILSVTFPGLFIFAKADGNNLPIRFISGFLCIFLLWIINFALVDFTPLWARGQWKHLIARIGISVIGSMGVFLFVGYFIDNSGFLLSQIEGVKVTSFKAWFFLLLRIFFFDVLFILIKYVFDNDKEKRRIQLEVETLKGENILATHEALKQQVSPHFLFNSLTTLKSLVKHNTELSLEFIDELSSVYRYMLSHNGKNEVTLNEEVAFLRSYLHLLKLRFGDSIITEIEIPESASSYKMPPNTLQLLVENAVKHNILSGKRPLRISIFIHQQHLVVENNLQYKESKNNSSHVGLSNINSRYQILKGKSILIEKDDLRFKVSLPIT